MSTIMGTMMSIQPSRMRLKVPSKSKRACSGGAAIARGLTSSIAVPGRKLVLSGAGQAAL